MSDCDPLSAPAQSLADWLSRDISIRHDAATLVAALGKRLRASGVPVERITTGIPMLHPQLASSSMVWQPGAPPIERLWQQDERTFHTYQRSPLFVVYNGGGAVRCRIGPTPESEEYSVIPDLRAEGITDYLVLPAPFSDGSIKAMTFATKTPNGFSEAAVATLEALMPTLALILEAQTLHRTARTLLDTYVGPMAGTRVLEGAIHRGMSESIRAVIWFCDLRGFTELSGRHPREAVIALLNDYFGAMTEAVADQGGEVLKFIGDAMLAIFPLSAAARSSEAAADAALTAAGNAAVTIAAHNDTRVEADQPTIRYGIALHVGDVLYGNIGGATRLDFTVIGPAVNLASRVEGLCGELGRSLLCSADFAALSQAPLETVGRFDLKGIAEPQQVFAPSGM